MFRGSIPPLPTPFRRGQIDEEALRALVERAIREGSHGISVGGTTGEPGTQTLEERKRVIALALEQAVGRVPVIPGTGALRLEETLELTRFAQEAGAQGAMVIVPYGYAVLLGRVLLAVRLAGLHPEVGFLHAEGRRNPSLALDLMEEFRVPVVDAVVLSAFRRGGLTPHHAEVRAGGVYLNEEGKRVFLTLLEERLLQEATHPLGFRRPYQELIEVQASRLKAALLGREGYTPFYLRGR